MISKIDSLNLVNCSWEDSLKCGVYTIEHVAKPNMYYVGSTAGIKTNKCSGGFRSRWLSHFAELQRETHKNQYLQRVVNKYGLEGLRFEILEDTAPDIAVFIEQYWINILCTCDSKFGYNLNPTATSGKGRVLSGKSLENVREAAKKKRGISFINAGSFIKGTSPWNKGKKMDEKYSKALNVKHNIGEKFYTFIKEKSEKSRQDSKRIIISDINKNIIGIFRSIPDLVEFSKENKNKLPLVLKGRAKDLILRSQQIYQKADKNITYKDMYFNLINFNWEWNIPYILIPEEYKSKDLSDLIWNCGIDKAKEVINELLWK